MWIPSTEAENGVCNHIARKREGLTTEKTLAAEYVDAVIVEGRTIFEAKEKKMSAKSKTMGER